MKKALKLIFAGVIALVLLVVVLLVVDISNDDKETAGEGTTKQTTDEEAFKTYAENITGRSFVKDVSLVDNHSVITFYGDFDEFKAAKPDSNLTEEDYKGYFETGDAVKKILVIENVRLLRQFPTLNGSIMTLPYDGNTYSIEMDRESVNEYLGFNVEDLKTEDDSWNEKFLDPIGYDEEKRNNFFNEFGNVE